MIIGKTKEQLEIEELSRQNEEKIKENLNYLKDTDWYVTRFSENGTLVPLEILNKRIEARDLISLLRQSSGA